MLRGSRQHNYVTFNGDGSSLKVLRFLICGRRNPTLGKVRAIIYSMMLSVSNLAVCLTCNAPGFHGCQLLSVIRKDPKLKYIRRSQGKSVKKGDIKCVFYAAKMIIFEFRLTFSTRVWEG
ncbi:unnamed protein product [Blumeria hordei]|uniref:Uncharacterized protein n=1 Tax=Blumeria hordei TaxID=2867405 RepID=A0A383UVI0_BLUHO|nr:unnamed protein product [Blumeria hordei]